MIYIDTSVLVAYYYPEEKSSEVEHLLINTDKPAISQLTAVEFTSALSKKIREHTLTKQDGVKLIALFRDHIRHKSFYNLPVKPNHYSKASSWISLFTTPLRTLDALHLAIAQENDITIVTSDVKLAGAADLLKVKFQFI